MSYQSANEANCKLSDLTVYSWPEVWFPKFGYWRRLVLMGNVI